MPNLPDESIEKIISYQATPHRSIKWGRLKEFAFRTSFDNFDAESFDWGKIRELHILASDGKEQMTTTLQEDVPHIEWEKAVLNNRISIEDYGVYYNETKEWMLVFGYQIDEYVKCLHRCSKNLKVLDIRFTDCHEIDLSNAMGISRLNLSYNNNLKKIIGLDLCPNIYELDLSYTLIDNLPDLGSFPILYFLNVKKTNIQSISISKKLKKLKFLNIPNTLISECSFISFLPSLVFLNISITCITKLPSLESLRHLGTLNCSHLHIKQLPVLINLPNLHSLNIGYTDITTLEGILFPKSLTSLNIEGTRISKIPNNVTSLKNLRKLILFDMQLDTLSANILDLNLQFNMENKGFGICLSNTIIKDMDINILQQPRAIIESWFKNKDKENSCSDGHALNEIKVVFLGDGGAGKTLSISRLINSGKLPENFDGNSTPGISIIHCNYNISDENILVHFWDFGGQEIMHSMHRMFLTKRTLYIVFVNARDNTQDERARYWLHNIKTFANDSKVILVLNQIDQNPSASVNEPALRDLYPNLAPIVKLSATSYTEEEFRSSLINSLMYEISNMSYINEPFLNSWNNLKNKLQSMKEYYINAETYKSMSEECGVEEQEDIRVKLLDWFSDLGISFCYRDSSALSNYMILRPDWITNAIYIILFNGFEKSINGLISHEDIHKLLSFSRDGEIAIKRVIKNISYTPIETEYVLGVIRKFKLSYRMDEETEFIPMLCNRNENIIAKDFIDKSDILEFRMEYSYLPNNVIHRLMVEMRHDLVQDCVWLTGAVFSSDTMGLKALVKIEDNALKIYVSSKNKLFSANVYLAFIRNVIKNINESLGLSASEIIVYKKDGQKDEFEYDYLIESYNHGNVTDYSRVFKQNISIVDILNQTDGDINRRETKIVKDVVDACLSMQATKLYWESTEDERNTYIRNMLRHAGYSIADQTLWGKSESGKNAGELDIEIMESANKPVAIYEALNLSDFSSTSKTYWGKHLSKLLDNYNPTGLPFSFLVSYVGWSKDDFKVNWLNYYNYISQNCDNKYSIQRVQERDDKTFYLRSAKCIYDRAGIPTTVYHIVVRLGD